ncbi:MAG: GNAT family N-acetyltransferase [Patescibacteria group bacterium]|nr:GNAT family N-acetyltransferase [Patescibacteria group bacterium]
MRIDMQIRPATIEDAEGIYNVNRITWLDTYPNEEYDIRREDIVKKFSDTESLIDKTRQRIEEYGADSQGWVAESDGKIIGFSIVRKKDGHDTIGAIYVLPEYQGKGIGTMLLQKILEFRKDSKELWLDVASYNTSAINFYKKAGFQIVPKSEGKYETIDGKFLPTISMKLMR